MGAKIGNKNAKRLPKGEGSFNQIYRNYTNGAKQRHIKFNLTKEQFKSLTSLKCHYCNSEPVLINHARKFNGAYLANGIDRLNNKIGYEIGNCVSCCKVCNYMKLKMTKEDFLHHVKKIANYNNL